MDTRAIIYLATDSIYVYMYIIFDTVAEPQDVKSTRRVTIRQKSQLLDSTINFRRFRHSRCILSQFNCILLARREFLSRIHEAGQL